MRGSTKVRLLVGLVVAPNVAAAEATFVRPIPADGSSVLAKRFDVAAGAVVNGVRFECSAGGVSFPQITLVRGSGTTLDTDGVVRNTSDFVAPSSNADLTWSPVAVGEATTYFVVIKFPVGGVGELATILADDTESPNGSYVAGSIADALLPVRANLRVSLLGSDLDGIGKARLPRETFGPGADIRTTRHGASIAVTLDCRESCDARLDVYDVGGRLVRQLFNGPVDAGQRDIVWDARLPGGALAGAGMYFVRLRAGDVDVTRKVLVIR